MLRQTRHISFIETAGELGALLLEAQLIKQQQPLFNKRLRRSKQLCALRLQADTVTIAHAKEIDFAVTPHLYGLFANRHAALEKLRAIADEHRLCYGKLGIDKLPAGRLLLPLQPAQVRRCLLRRGAGAGTCAAARRGAGTATHRLLAVRRASGVGRAGRDAAPVPCNSQLVLSGLGQQPGAGTAAAERGQPL